MAERPEPTRRLALGRLIAGLLLGAGGLVALWLAGSHLFGSAARWLEDRPAYQLPFDAIRLEPPPPAYIRGGAPALLSRVRTRARRPETFSVLGADLQRLADDLKRESPWVREVGPIRRGGLNRLTVTLEYREPLVVLRLFQPDWPVDSQLPTEHDLILDCDGVVLPFEEIDPKALPPTIVVHGSYPPGTAAAGDGGIYPPGTTKESLAPLDGRTLEPDETKPWGARLAQALRLADFFRRRQAAAPQADPPVRVVEIAAKAKGGPQNRPRDRGQWWVYVEQDGAESTIDWAKLPPGEEFEEECERRWSFLLDWLGRTNHLDRRNSLADVQRPAFLSIDHEALQVRGRAPERRPNPTRED